MSGGLTLYMVWKGVGSDSRLFFATTSAGADLRIQQWSDQSVIPNVGSIVEPALAGFRSQLYLAWRGIQDDHGLYFGSFDGNGWSFLGKIADVGSWDTPALANYQNKLYMAWRGIPGDSDLYYSAFDGHDWFPKPQQLIPDRGSALGPSLAVVGQRLHMAWRGIDSVDGNDYHLYHSVFDGTWSPPVRTDFISYMKPSISYYGVDNFGMAWRGLGPGDSDQTFYFTRFDGVNWQVPVKHLSDRGSWNTPTIATYT